MDGACAFQRFLLFCKMVLLNGHFEIGEEIFPRGDGCSMSLRRRARTSACFCIGVGEKGFGSGFLGEIKWGGNAIVCRSIVFLH